LSKDKKNSPAFCNFEFDVCLIFLLRYYGSCYRLQHVEEKKSQKRTRVTCQRRANTSKKEKHAEKSKKGERRQKKRAKIARCLIKR